MTISSSDIRCPSTSAFTRMENRSSVGSARRLVMMLVVNSVYAANAAITAWAVSDVGSMCELSPQTRSSDHFNSMLRSVGSTPSMSPITAIGSGAAISRTKSHSPRSHTASMRVSHSRAIDGSFSLTRLRVKPALTSLRRNRCAGSSMSIM